MEIFHIKIMEEYGGKIKSGGSKKVPPVVVHNGDWYTECDGCSEILRYRDEELDRLQKKERNGSDDNQQAS